MAIKPTLSNLKPPRGSRHRKVRVGRGMGSKLGKTSGAGNKGQQSRRGYSRRPGFEGGQMPLHRRLPKRGFSSPFRKTYAVVNVESLNVFEAGDTVSPEMLFRLGSTTKMMTASAVVGLAVEGKLDLEAPVGRYITGLDPAIAKPSVRTRMNSRTILRKYSSASTHGDI